MARCRTPSARHVWPWMVVKGQTLRRGERSAQSEVRHSTEPGASTRRRLGVSLISRLLIQSLP